MKLSTKQVSENRERVLDAALKLFRQRGFDGVSVADLMREAGLTHGGFYNHFESKTDLSAQTCARAFGLALDHVGKMEAPQTAGRLSGVRGYISRYLSRSWRDADAAHCPMVAFAADAARDPDALGQPFAAGVGSYLEGLSGSLDGDEEERRRKAILLASALIGALALARGVRGGDPALSDEILNAARNELLALVPSPGEPSMRGE